MSFDVSQRIHVYMDLLILWTSCGLAMVCEVSFPLTDQPHIYDARRFNVTGFASPG